MSRFASFVAKSLLAFVLVAIVPPAVPHLLALRLPGPGSVPADAIIVPTGAEGRIAEGYRLYRQGKAGHLVILGVGGNAKATDLLPKGTETFISSLLGRIIIERYSENTFENAFAAKTIVTERGFRRLILVTSDHHLARAHMALRLALPTDTVIEAVGVPSSWRGRDWWRTIRHFWLEGWKFWGYRLVLKWE